MNKFKLDSSTNHYIKRFIFEDKVYDINIPKEQWSQANRKKIERFLKKENMLSFPPPCNSFITVVENDCINNNQCEFCNKVFSRVSNKVRHQQKCKLKGVTNIRTYNDNSTNNITNNITNNNDHSTNITNNITNNITVKLCDFGKEDTSWLTTNILHCLILPKMEGMKKLIACKHFNEKYPQNQNIRMNKEDDIDKYVQVQSKGKWRLKDINDVIKSLHYDIAEIATTVVYGDFMEDFDEHEQSVLEAFRTIINERKKKLINNIWKDITLDEEGKKRMKHIIEFLLLNKDLLEKQSE